VILLYDVLLILYLAVIQMLVPLMDVTPLLVVTTLLLTVTITVSVLKISVILNRDVGTKLLMNSELVLKDTVMLFSDGSFPIRTAMTTILVLQITAILLAKKVKMSANMSL